LTQRGLTQPPVSLGGRTIIDQVLRNAEAGQFELGYTVLLPATFNLYLHPVDYDRLSGIFPHIRDDARRALQERIAQLNSPPSRFRTRKNGLKQYKIATSDFSFEFFSDPDGSVPLGDIEIHSELADTPRPGYHGVRTTLIGREPSVRPQAAEVPAAATERVYAEIRYEDDSGTQLYLVTQEEISIGRGGDGRIVDLALYSEDKISREHLRIRRDPVRNRFTIVDLSMNGTTVDGRKLVRNTEESLPKKALIELAEHLTIHFEQRS